MNDYENIDFTPLVALSDDEVVTRSFVRDVPLSGGRVLALITLDNGRDHTRPNTLGPTTLLELREVFDGLRERATRGEIHGVAVTGKPFILAAGADLSQVDIVGIYPNYASAYAIWKQKAQMTVDSAQTRYFIVHLHRLLDPATPGA